MKAIWSALFTAVACATTSFAGNSLPGTFDIFSYNPTESTTTKLDFVQIFAIIDDSFYVLSTAPQTVDWQGLTLSAGIIKTIPPPGYLGPVESIGAVYASPDDYPTTTPGPFPTWANQPEATTSSELWTAADNGDGNSILSLSGSSDLFSLCASYFNGGLALTAVVFNANYSSYEERSETYNGATCVPVTLLAIARASD
ncbi:hypothetical protein PsYK624_055780 [Phanerochaete sordida]|uniref:Uncharacterized protein n=1 Tax=Phanerochaete sordida TaxID=48140 RepID=A0A9P3G7G8_9APHY|nr:hypothetical protein PsYK624_055780 [Phanerochaete sordida]